MLLRLQLLLLSSLCKLRILSTFPFFHSSPSPQERKDRVRKGSAAPTPASSAFLRFLFPVKLVPGMIVRDRKNATSRVGGIRICQL